MGIRKRYTLDELRVLAMETHSEHYLKQYKKMLEVKQVKEDKKNNFQDLLDKELASYGHFE